MSEAFLLLVARIFITLQRILRQRFIIYIRINLLLRRFVFRMAEASAKRE